MISFKLQHTDTKTFARAGELTTSYGTILTPVFMPVGTLASVKSLDSRDLFEIGVQIVMTNTYHLHLQPGEDVVKKFGGVAKFMEWDKPTMTDSGGFQVFSLGVGGEVKLLKGEKQAHGFTSSGKDKRNELASSFGEVKPRLNKITEAGVYFQSHIDGRRLVLTPENSIEIQSKLGADLIVAFDDLESPRYSYDETLKSLERTERWELRSKETYLSLRAKQSNLRDRHVLRIRDDDLGQQLLYGVTHGGQYEDLRVRSAKFVDNHFDAIALGGAHGDKCNMYEVVKWTTKNVDPTKPRHMLGVGEIDDIFNIVSLGIDTFDCVIPTRIGRTGWVFVSPPEGNPRNKFRIDITKSIYIDDKKPIDANCSCMVCTKFTRGYINFLFKSKELTAYRLATYHNVYFFTRLMKSIRESILNNLFNKLQKKWLK